MPFNNPWRKSSPNNGAPGTQQYYANTSDLSNKPQCGSRFSNPQILHGSQFSPRASVPSYSSQHKSQHGAKASSASDNSQFCSRTSRTLCSSQYHEAFFNPSSSSRDKLKASSTSGSSNISSSNDKSQASVDDLAKQLGGVELKDAATQNKAAPEKQKRAPRRKTQTWKDSGLDGVDLGSINAAGLDLNDFLH